MPLEFDDKWLLAPGLHPATLEEVEQAFGRFQRTDRRMTLARRLRAYVAALQQARIAGSLILDGSFIMPRVDLPEDIDLILVLPKDWDTTADLKPYQYNLVSKRRVKQEFRFDLFTVRSGSIQEAQWVAFFSQVNPKWCDEFDWPRGLTKGLVRVAL